MMLSFVLSAALVVQDPPDATAIVVEAIRTGAVGERFDGYLDFAREPSDRLRRAVGAINIRRRVLYSDLGARNRLSPNEVGMTTACKLLLRVPEGGSYRLSDGEWRTRSVEAPLTLPTYCPNASR